MTEDLHAMPREPGYQPPTDAPLFADGLAHDLYVTGDSDAPPQVVDRNGEVVLGCCRRCGRAEVELAEPCATLKAVQP